MKGLMENRKRRREKLMNVLESEVIMNKRMNVGVRMVYVP